MMLHPEPVIRARNGESDGLQLRIEYVKLKNKECFQK